jgi:hypothetical protein
MTLHAATAHLWQTAHQLREDLLALRLQAVEDRPLEGSNKLVEDVGSMSETMAGWGSELLDCAARAASAAAYPMDIAGLRQGLDACVDRAEQLAAVLHERLVATARLDELSYLARHSSKELRAWVGAIKQALDQVYRGLWTVQATLTICWRELADRAAPSSSGEPAEPARRR